jgi:hypothetical protein
MRELCIPIGVDSDDNATEMIRYWLAHNKPHISLILGMYQDAQDCEVDELYAWGNILGDIAQHIANGLEQSHGWDFDETARKLVTYFTEAMASRAPGLEGGYPESA